MLSLVTPADPVVTLAEAKRHLRVDHNDDDLHIDSLILATTAWIDGADGWLGRALGEQEWQLSVSAFPLRDLKLPLAPLISVESVSYTDTSGSEITFDNFRVVGAGTTGPGSIVPSFGYSWPMTGSEPDAVRVAFTAGYGSVPAPIRHAILLMVGHYYESREAVTTEKPDILPLGVDALLMPYRIWTV